MKRIAHLSDGYIVNVSLGRDDAELQPGQMLEADALAAGYGYKPSQSEPNRKIWLNSGDFWNQFTPTEQLAIMDSTQPEIRLLDRALVVWAGEVWSDDPRVQNGLDALITAGIISAERKAEILT